MLNLGFAACLSPSDDGGGGTGGTGTAGSGGSTGSAGTVGSGGSTGIAGTSGTAGVTGSSGSTGTAGVTGSGGSTGTAGVTGSGGSTGAAGTGGGGGSGGVTGTGGSVGGRGGVTGTAGSGTAGSGGSAGGGAGRGGTTGSAGAGGTTGSGGTGAGACVKGQTKGKDVAILGESFIAATHQITTNLESLAKAAGSLPQSERYVDNSVSGTTIAGANGNVDQYNKAVTSSGTIKYVIMNGGGNDCLQANNPSQALTGADKLFTLMAQKGTEKVVYFFYPDPIGSTFSNLKSCLDTLRPQMKAKCDGLTAPKCYWLDLRTAWAGHNEYTNDGIHPTAAGSKATAEAIWPVAVANCVAQ